MTATIKKYLNAFEKSQQVLNQLRILTFPIDIFSVLKDAGIFVETVSEFKAHFPSNKTQIRDARCYYYVEANEYLILYNENVNEYRIRFSLAHELGHIVLGHLNEEITELSRGGLDDITYYKMEGEANVFAGNFLAPPIIINEIVGNDFYDTRLLMKTFALSEPSLNEYRKRDFILWQFIPMLPEEKQIISRYKNPVYRCINCQYEITSKNTKYCPICGNNKFTDKEGKIELYYDDFDELTDGRLRICHVCKNEDIGYGIYCPICGFPVENKCTGDKNKGVSCGPVSKGNFRYCPDCGSTTTFFARKLLKSWEEEQKQKKIDEIVFDDNDLLSKIDEAIRMKKYIIGVKPWGQERIPIKIQNNANIMVGWNSSSVTNAIKNS